MCIEYSSRSQVANYHVVSTLAESHCSIHTFQEKGYCFVDIFSCKQFDTEKALIKLVDIFEARECEMRIIERGKNFPR
mgnify:CR=1 FL=1